jgi:DNA-binding CsgD family transcriptional regulator
VRKIHVALSLRSALLANKISSRLADLPWAGPGSPADVTVTDAADARGPHTVAVLPSFGGWISPRLVSCLLPSPPPVSLTLRERETLRLLAEGWENAEIAAAMFITVSAVKFHVSNLLRKFGCRDRTQLVSRLGRPLPLVS